MKKILAIMLIAVIAVAGVFAYTAPTNTSVVLNYVVNGVYQPAYKLHYDGNGSNTNPSDTAADYFDGTTAIVVSNSNQVTLEADSEDGGIAAGTAKFSLYDFSYVKSAVSNKLTLTVALPTDARWLNTDTLIYSNSLCEIGDVVLDDTTEQVDGDDTDTTKATIYSAPAPESGKGVVVTYDAEETIYRADNNHCVKIASFDVTWNADKEADPATYKTTLTVSVKTE